MNSFDTILVNFAQCFPRHRHSLYLYSPTSHLPRGTVNQIANQKQRPAAAINFYGSERGRRASARRRAFPAHARSQRRSKALAFALAARLWLVAFNLPQLDSHNPLPGPLASVSLSVAFELSAKLDAPVASSRTYPSIHPREQRLNKNNHSATVPQWEKEQSREYRSNISRAE